MLYNTKPLQNLVKYHDIYNIKTKKRLVYRDIDLSFIKFKRPLTSSV